MIEIEWKGVVDLYQKLQRIRDMVKSEGNSIIKLSLCSRGLEIIKIIKAQESLNEEVK